MRLIVIRPGVTPTVIEASKVDCDRIQNILEVDLFDIAEREIGGKMYDIYLDDEGLLKEKKYISAVCGNAKEILCGNLLIAKHDRMGEVVGLTQEDIENIMAPRNSVSIKAIRDEIRVPKGIAEFDIDYGEFGKVTMKEDGVLLFCNAR